MPRVVTVDLAASTLTATGAAILNDGIETATVTARFGNGSPKSFSTVTVMVAAVSPSLGIVAALVATTLFAALTVTTRPPLMASPPTQARACSPQ